MLREIVKILEEKSESFEVVYDSLIDSDDLDELLYTFGQSGDRGDAITLIKKGKEYNLNFSDVEAEVDERKEEVIFTFYGPYFTDMDTEEVISGKDIYKLVSKKDLIEYIKNNIVSEETSTWTKLAWNSKRKDLK